MEELKQKLKDFLESGENSMNIDMIPLDIFKNLVEELGFAADEYNSNGWQVDFWYYFEHKDLGRYCLGGSLFYGNFCFSK